MRNCSTLIFCRPHANHTWTARATKIKNKQINCLGTLIFYMFVYVSFIFVCNLLLGPFLRSKIGPA